MNKKINIEFEFLFERDICIYILYIKFKMVYGNKIVYWLFICFKSLFGWNDGIIFGYGWIEKFVI